MSAPDRESPFVAVEGFHQVSPHPRVVTIGTFDGVHRGHQLLLRQTSARAQALGVRSSAVTFEPVPSLVLRPDRFPGRVCSAAEKMRHLALSGVSEVVVVPFDLDLARMSPEEFMQTLADRLRPVELWVGENFALGRNRVGDVPRLTQIGHQLGFRVVALHRIRDGNLMISSSAIRSAIAEGDVETARLLLGRPFRVSGEVIHGAHLGRKIGFPTANVVPPSDLVPLADGIYASLAFLPGDRHARAAMTYVGTRPTVNSGERQIETHLFDFDDDIYHRELTVDLYGRLRPDEHFPDLDTLVAQLEKDEAAARAYLARPELSATPIV